MSAASVATAFSSVGSLAKAARWWHFMRAICWVLPYQQQPSVSIDSSLVLDACACAPHASALLLIPVPCAGLLAASSACL